MMRWHTVKQKLDHRESQDTQSPVALDLKFVTDLIMVEIEYILEMFKQMFNTPTHEVEVDDSIKVERDVSR